MPGRALSRGAQARQRQQQYADDAPVATSVFGGSCASFEEAPSRGAAMSSPPRAAVFTSGGQPIAVVRPSLSAALVVSSMMSNLNGQPSCARMLLQCVQYPSPPHQPESRSSPCCFSARTTPRRTV